MFKQEIAALVDAASAIRASAEAEGRQLTDQELDQIEANLAKVETLKAKQERADKLGASLDSESKQLDAVAPRKTVAQPSASVKVGEPEWKKDPNKGFANHREFLFAVQNFEKRGKRDERLDYLAAAGSDEHTVQNDPHGGFLVPEGMAPGLMKIDPEVDPTAMLTTKLPMTAPSVKVNARVDKNHSTSVAGGLTVSRKEETTAGSTSRMKFEQIDLTANTLFGAAYASNEILTDSPMTFAALLAQGFEEAFTDHLFDEKINGSGVGEFQGVVNSPAFISVAKEGGQAADTVVKENILKMRARCWGYQNAVWLANHDMYPEIATIGGDGNGSGNLWQQSMVEGQPDRLLGRPIIFTEYTKSLGNANDIMLINWTQYLEGLYQPMQSAESIHVRFLNNENTYKFWLRNDAKSWWLSPLTPRNSADTLSPFVGLAERA